MQCGAWRTSSTAGMMAATGLHKCTGAGRGLSISGSPLRFGIVRNRLRVRNHCEIGRKASKVVTCYWRVDLTMKLARWLWNLVSRIGWGGS